MKTEIKNVDRLDVGDNLETDKFLDDRTVVESGLKFLLNNESELRSVIFDSELGADLSAEDSKLLSAFNFLVGRLSAMIPEINGQIETFFGILEDKDDVDKTAELRLIGQFRIIAQFYQGMADFDDFVN